MAIEKVSVPIYVAAWICNIYSLETFSRKIEKKKKYFYKEKGHERKKEEKKERTRIKKKDRKKDRKRRKKE
jgi:hypothetical protein